VTLNVQQQEQLLLLQKSVLQFFLSQNSKQKIYIHIETNMYDKVFSPSTKSSRSMWKSSMAASTTYILATATFVASAVICIVHPSPPPDTAADVRVPNTAVCVRASRYADYATARLVLGTPAREVETFIRLDRVAESSLTSTLIWASMVSQSHTLNCTSDWSSCSDMTIVQPAGPRSDLQWAFSRFALHPDYNDYSTVSQLGLKAMLFMVKGYDYYLTTTHFCWTQHIQTSCSENAVDVHVDSNGYLQDLSGSLGTCTGTSTRLFPYKASSEPSWLALTDRYLFEHDESHLQLRRAVVETGTLCTEQNATLYNSLLLYKAQCANTPSCQTDPSVPYRRIASHHTLHIQIPHDTNKSIIHVKESSTMSRLPSLLSASEATWIAIAQLCILVLVAAVSFVRDSQRAVSPSFILRHAFMRCIGERDHITIYSYKDVIINAIIGFLALLARASVVMASYQLLYQDNCERLVMSESIGCFVSLIHFILRNALHTKRETPLTKLGGTCVVLSTLNCFFSLEHTHTHSHCTAFSYSAHCTGPMSTIDVSCAILVSMADTPLLATRQTFSSVGKMLASLLILASGVQTLIYSSTACCMTAVCVMQELHYDKNMQEFAILLYLSTALWLAQTSCVAVTLCTAFVAPFVYSVTRTTTADTLVIRICTLLGVICTSMPSVNRISLSFSKYVKAHAGKH
jgi:hypothetical protein